MPAIFASAPGKIILFGEHAVVYGRPAIAIPLTRVRAKTVIIANPRGATGEVFLQAPDIDLNEYMSQLPYDHPLVKTIRLICDTLGIEKLPACTIRITSEIPVASGLGSGAAVSVSMIRALSNFIGHPFSDEQVNALTYEIEKVYHGTPSGIDNTVITYERPVFFEHPKSIEPLHVLQPFTLVIGDSGISSSTVEAVSGVRHGWQKDEKYYETLFDRIGEIVHQAKGLIETGTVDELGRLMIENHELLIKLGVSSPELNQLVEASIEAGALGAKMSGGGLGGNMIALVTPEAAPHVSQSLIDNGAVNTLLTVVEERA